MGYDMELAKRVKKSLNIFVKFMLIEGNFEDQVDLYFGSTAPGGYAWVIPKKNGANIGIILMLVLVPKRIPQLGLENLFGLGGEGLEADN